jgi:cation diffusion facilitator CzcD-associated flavoprotein CzcO
MAMEHIDVLIIGAGISGIGAACHLSMKSPDQSFAVMEGRKDLGGTWDLFRYPGIRSDSDMYTFGYSFRPWDEGSDIAPAENIKRYLKDTAHAYQIDKKIRYEHKIVRVEWLSEKQHWVSDVLNQASGESFQISSRFLLCCTGYYDYNKAYLPEFTGYDDFKGQVVHPQFWPENFDYSGKRVLVIGSGATAITLVPSLTDKAEHVTMLQRSPTYVFTRPGVDPWAKFFKRCLPASWAHRLTRVKNVLLSHYMFTMSKKKPEKIKQFLRDMVKAEVGDAVDVDVHFNPSYNPWDQRMCLVPDSDLFKALKNGKASIKTEHIEQFNATGVELKSGEQINADIIVPATGLSLQFLGGIDAYVDGQQLDTGELVSYKGMMYGDVPNFALIFGYTNASWTLKADLTAGYICRLLNYMKKHGHSVVVPSLGDSDIEKEPMIGNLNSGYILRATDIIPKQGAKAPWRNPDSYIKDFFTIRFGGIEDDVLKFY